MSTRKKIPLIDASAELAVTGTVTLTGSGSAVITFPSVSCSFANPGTSGNVMTSDGTDWKSRPNDGWIDANETWTVASVDGKITVFTVPSGATDKYSIGMRIKYRASLSVYGIIVAVSDTTITVFSGNSGSLVPGASDSYTKYSMVKCPFGFPMDPTYWQVSYSFATMTGPDSPTAFTWYNNGSSYSIPIGSWNILIKTISNIERNTGGFISTEISFSTTNNAAGEPYLSCKSAFRENANPCQQATNFIQGPLSVTTKTTYYLNERTLNTGCQYLRLQQDNAPTTVILTCAYL